MDFKKPTQRDRLKAANDRHIKHEMRKLPDEVQECYEACPEATVQSFYRIQQKERTLWDIEQKLIQPPSPEVPSRDETPNSDDGRFIDNRSSVHGDYEQESESGDDSGNSERSEDSEEPDEPEVSEYPGSERNSEQGQSENASTNSSQDHSGDESKSRSEYSSEEASEIESESATSTRKPVASSRHSRSPSPSAESYDEGTPGFYDGGGDGTMESPGVESVSGLEGTAEDSSEQESGEESGEESEEESEEESASEDETKNTSTFDYNKPSVYPNADLEVIRVENPRRPISIRLNDLLPDPNNPEHQSDDGDWIDISKLDLNVFEQHLEEEGLFKPGEDEIWCSPCALKDINISMINIPQSDESRLTNLTKFTAVKGAIERYYSGLGTMNSTTDSGVAELPRPSFTIIIRKADTDGELLIHSPCRH